MGRTNLVRKPAKEFKTDRRKGILLFCLFEVKTRSQLILNSFHSLSCTELRLHLPGSSWFFLAYEQMFSHVQVIVSALLPGYRVYPLPEYYSSLDAIIPVLWFGRLKRSPLIVFNPNESEHDLIHASLFLVIDFRQGSDLLGVFIFSSIKREPSLYYSTEYKAPELPKNAEMSFAILVLFCFHSEAV